MRHRVRKSVKVFDASAQVSQQRQSDPVSHLHENVQQSGKHFGTFASAHGRKDLQMHLLHIGLLRFEHLEKAFENAHRRKAIQMSFVHQIVHSVRKFETTFNCAREIRPHSVV